MVYCWTKSGVSICYSVNLRKGKVDLSVLGENHQGEDVVLVFRPPENPAAQIAGITPFKSLRLKLDELLDWFKELNVDSIDLWIEGAWKSGNRTELFLSVEGKTGAKITLRPYSKRGQATTPPEILESSTQDSSKPASKDLESSKANTDKTVIQPPTLRVTALFSPAGGVERHVVSLIDSAVGSIEIAAYQLTNMYIAKALLEGVKRGVKVAVVLDREETRGRQGSVHDTLERAGCEIRLISPTNGVMHDKYIIIDGKTVEWGSYNYTENSETVNFENATFASDSSLGQQYHSDFASIFNQGRPELRGIRRAFARFLRRF